MMGSSIFTRAMYLRDWMTLYIVMAVVGDDMNVTVVATAIVD